MVAAGSCAESKSASGTPSSRHLGHMPTGVLSGSVKPHCGHLRFAAGAFLSGLETSDMVCGSKKLNGRAWEREHAMVVPLEEKLNIFGEDLRLCLAGP